MTEETFKKKQKELTNQYVYWAQIRNNAMSELKKIINKSLRLEEKYFKQNEKIEE